MAAFVAATMATGCSDDDPKSSKTFAEATRTEANGLNLTVGGATMPGMTVEFAPAANASEGTLKVYSRFDLAAIPGAPEALKQSIAGPGAIPGTPELTIPVTIELDQAGTTGSFQGSGATEYASYNYSGTITDNAINLAFSDVRLKNVSLAGRYALEGFTMDEDWESDTYGTIFTNPIYVNWQSGASLDFLGTPMTPEDLCKLLFTMPLLDDMTVTVPNYLTTLLKDVTFGQDGNITANYLDLDADNESVRNYITSPVNMAQYVVASDKQMLFFLNPAAVVADASRAVGPVDMNNVLGNVLGQLAPMMTNGVPMQYRKSADGKMSVYLATETLLPLLKQNVLPLLRNEAVVNQLVEMVGQTDMGAFIAPLLPGMIASAADVIEQTTVLEIGLNLTAQN